MFLRRALLAVFSMLLASGLGAQDRDLVFGVVRDESGQPWVGAEVRFVSRVLGRVPELRGVDEVVVESDKRGRFRAQILEGRAYTAWAGDPESGRVSRILERVVCRVPVILEESTTHGSTSLKLGNLDALGDGPFVLRLSNDASNLVEFEAPVEGGEIRIPALTGNTLDCVLLRPDGSFVAHRRLGSFRRTLKFEAPKERKLSVRDIDSDEGVGGARVVRVVGSRIYELGRTEADGTLTVAISGDLGHDSIRVVASDYGIAAFQDGPEKKRQDGTEWPPLREGFEADHHVRVRRGYTLHGQVLLRPGTPAAGMQLVVDYRGMHFQERNSRYLTSLTRVFETDAEGRFEIDACLAEYPPIVHAVLEPKHQSAMPDGHGLRRASFVHGLFVGPTKGDGRIDLDTTVLSEIACLDLQIQSESAAPVGAAEVELRQLGSEFQITQIERKLVADRAGRLVLPMPLPFRPWVTVRSGVAQEQFELVADREALRKQPARLTVKVGDPIEVRVRLVDEDGAPIARRRVSVNSRSSRGQVGEPPEFSVEPEGAGIELESLKRNTVGRPRLRSMWANTDEEGRAVLNIPAMEAAWQIYGQGFKYDLDSEELEAGLEIEIEAVGRESSQ